MSSAFTAFSSHDMRSTCVCIKALTVVRTPLRNVNYPMPITPNVCYTVWATPSYGCPQAGSILESAAQANLRLSSSNYGDVRDLFAAPSSSSLKMFSASELLLMFANCTSAG
eukprot:4217458-Karenia_brevis.AAC.1